MDFFLSHTTALAALRSWKLRRILERGERADVLVPETLPTVDEVAELRRKLPSIVGEEELELAVRSGRPGARRRTGVRAHLESEPLPEGAAVCVADGVVCASPELVVVQMAPRLTDLELTVLLCELLGLYAVNPDAEDGMIHRDVPATTPERLRAFLDALGPRRGVRRVRKALTMAFTGSGSPRETKLCLRFTLRPGLGGWHLRLLSMNEPVEVQRIHNAMKRGVRKPDILLCSESEHEQQKVVAVEYSGRVHDLPAQVTIDAARTNELTALGIGEYVVRREQYADLDYMDGLVERIRSDLALPRTGMTAEEAGRRRTLRQQLFEELELIDGIHWNGRGRARRRATASSEEPPSWDVVPVEAYGID